MDERRMKGGFMRNEAGTMDEAETKDEAEMKQGCHLRGPG